MQLKLKKKSQNKLLENQRGKRFLYPPPPTPTNILDALPVTELIDIIQVWVIDWQS